MSHLSRGQYPKHCLARAGSRCTPRWFGAIGGSLFLMTCRESGLPSAQDLSTLCLVLPAGSLVPGDCRVARCGHADLRNSGDSWGGWAGQGSWVLHWSLWTGGWKPHSSSFVEHRSRSCPASLGKFGGLAFGWVSGCQTAFSGAGAGGFDGGKRHRSGGESPGRRDQRGGSEDRAGSEGKGIVMGRWSQERGGVRGEVGLKGERRQA